MDNTEKLLLGVLAGIYVVSLGYILVVVRRRWNKCKAFTNDFNEKVQEFIDKYKHDFTEEQVQQWRDLGYEV